MGICGRQGQTCGRACTTCTPPSGVTTPSMSCGQPPSAASTARDATAIRPRISCAHSSDDFGAADQCVRCCGGSNVAAGSVSVTLHARNTYTSCSVEKGDRNRAWRGTGPRQIMMVLPACWLRELDPMTRTNGGRCDHVSRADGAPSGRSCSRVVGRRRDTSAAALVQATGRNRTAPRRRSCHSVPGTVSRFVLR